MDGTEGSGSTSSWRDPRDERSLLARSVSTLGKVNFEFQEGRACSNLHPRCLALSGHSGNTYRRGQENMQEGLRCGAFTSPAPLG